MSAIPQKVVKLLEKAKVKYLPLEHRKVYTAFDKAATLRVKPNLIGKTLILKINKDLVIVLIPANKNLDKGKFKKIAKAKKIDFISEKMMKNKFKGIKIGAVPPFGDLFKMPTFVDRSLLNLPKIIVNSGDYSTSIKITASSLRKITPGLVMGSFTKIKK